MLGQRTANLVFVAFVLAACAYFAWVAEGFETSGLLASSGLPSKFFPQLILGGVAACALIVGVLYTFKGSTGGDEGQTVFTQAGEARRGVLMLVVSVACYIIWQWFGFITMAVLLGPASLLAMGIRQPAVYAVVLTLTVFIYFVFTQGLNIQLV